MKRMAFALLTCAAMLGACDNDRPAPAPGSDVAWAEADAGDTSATALWNLLAMWTATR